MYRKLFFGKTTIYLIIAFILIVYIITAHLIGTMRNYLLAQNERQILTSVQYLDKVLESYLVTLQAVQSAIALDEKNEFKTDKYLLEVLKNNKDIYCLNVINKQGRIIFSNLKGAKGLEVADRTYFQNVMKNHQPYVSNLYFGRISKCALITVAVPIVQKDKVIGVLSCGVTLDILQTIINKCIPLQNNGVGVSVVDGNGIVLYSSLHLLNLQNVSDFSIVKKLLQGEKGTEEIASPYSEGVRFFTFAPLAKSHWGIIISQPVGKVYGLLFSVISNVIIVILILLIPIIILFYRLFKLEKLRFLELSQLQNDKARTVNQLAASVAHEIRNPLTSIKGFIQLLSRNSLSEKSQQYIKVVIEEIDRLENITGEFLNFARTKEETKQVCDLKEILCFIYTLAQGRSIYQKVQVTLEAPKTFFFLGNSSQLKQAFLNFSLNAIQAMPDGGKLLIKLEQLDNQVVVSFADTGCGMSIETINHLGEHFFTTKKDGSGLGLAVSYRILEKHGAKITVSSKVGEGSIFWIKFPLDKQLNL